MTQVAEIIYCSVGLEVAEYTAQLKPLIFDSPPQMRPHLTDC